VDCRLGSNDLQANPLLQRPDTLRRSWFWGGCRGRARQPFIKGTFIPARPDRFCGPPVGSVVMWWPVMTAVVAFSGRCIDTDSRPACTASPFGVS